MPPTQKQKLADKLSSLGLYPQNILKYVLTKVNKIGRYKVCNNFFIHFLIKYLRYLLYNVLRISCNNKSYKKSLLRIFGTDGADVINFFYGRKIRIFVISQSVCPQQAFPAESNSIVWVQAKSLSLSGVSERFFKRVLLLYQKTLDQAGKACQGQIVQLITNVCNLRP